MGQVLLLYGVVTLVAAVAVCSGRDLRPSDHGLAYQEVSPSPPPPNGDAQGMLSFFGGTASSLELPEAKNISGTWWSARSGSGGGGARDAWRDRVRLGFLVASGVCGIIGVALLVVSGVVFLFRLQKQKLQADRVPSTASTATHGQAVNEK